MTIIEIPNSLFLQANDYHSISCYGDVLSHSAQINIDVATPLPRLYFANLIVMTPSIQKCKLWTS